MQRAPSAVLHSLHDSHIRLLSVGQVGQCFWGHPAKGQVAETLGDIHIFRLPRKAKVSHFQVLAYGHEDIPACQVPVQDTHSSQKLLERQRRLGHDLTDTNQQLGGLFTHHPRGNLVTKGQDV